MKKTILISMGLLLVVGCNSLKKDMASWVGHSVDDLQSAWGVPNATSNLNDGRTIMTWQEHWQDDWFGFTHDCRKSFTISPNGIVERWSVSNCKDSLPSISYEEFKKNK